LYFLLSPISEYIGENKIIRSYPIVWQGANLEDLLITQCLFVGDYQILPLHLAIYAVGNNVVVDHCVFYNCKVGVLYVNYQPEETTGNALTNNLFIGSYGAAVWIMNTSEDFVFEGNSIVNSNDNKKYKIQNSLFANNLELVGVGEGALLNFSKLSINSLEWGPKVNLSGKNLPINLDQSKKDYLHILPHNLTRNINSGLFKR